jgi:hypothetical protein
VTYSYCYSKFKISGMHTTRKYYSYVTPFHHRPLLCSYSVWAHVHTHTHTQIQSTPSIARLLDTKLTDNIKPLQTTIYMKGSSNIWAYPRCITHINDEETMPIYVRSQTLQTKPYLLTPWSWLILEKLTGSQPIKKFPAFYETQRFTSIFTSACHLSLSWARLSHN